MDGAFNYLIDPGTYYSGTHLDFSVSTFVYHTFTFLYSHNQHAYVTYVKVVVASKGEDHLFVHSVSQSKIIFQTKISIKYIINHKVANVCLATFQT